MIKSLSFEKNKLKEMSQILKSLSIMNVEDKIYVEIKDTVKEYKK